MVRVPSIVCIDDDEDDLMILREAIQKHNTALEVIEHRNGEAGIKYLHSIASEGKLPSLIFLDVNMPKLDGRQTVHQIKSHEHLKIVPVVIFTTSSGIADKRFFELYDVQYITKPNHFAEYARIVGQALIKYASLPG